MGHCKRRDGFVRIGPSTVILRKKLAPPVASRKVAAGPHRSAAQVAVEHAAVFGMRAAQTLGHENVHTVADQFVARIAEQRFRLRVDENDKTVPSAMMSALGAASTTSRKSS